MSALWLPLYVWIYECVSAVHSSRHHSKHEQAICKSNSAFNDMGNHLNLLKASMERKGACSSFRVQGSEMHKIATLLCLKESLERSRFK